MESKLTPVMRQVFWYNSDMSFSQNLFWDADPALLDYDSNRRYVIERVLNRGALSDLKLAFAHYGRDTLKTRILSAVRDFVKLV